jgi:hypothetical protein
MRMLDKIEQHYQRVLYRRENIMNEYNSLRYSLIPHILASIFSNSYSKRLGSLKDRYDRLDQLKSYIDYYLR